MKNQSSKVPIPNPEAPNTTPLESVGERTRILLQRAEEAQRKNDLVGVRNAFSEAVDSAPDAAPIRLALGSVLLQLNEFEDAKHHLAKATSQSPDNVLGWTQLALAYLRLHQIEDFENSLRRALELEPDNFHALKVLADAYLQGGEFVDAARFYGKLLLQQPKNIEVLLALGKCFFEKGDLDSAKSVYERCLDLHPGHPLARENLAVLHRAASLAKLPPEGSLSSNPKSSAPVGANSDTATGILVSALVSTYKSERFMRGCLEDLVAQSLYKRGGLEIIVVDSASPENERHIVEEFQKNYEHIVFLRTPRREPGSLAWNRAIGMARGKYLTPANTDDRHRPDALEMMSNVLEANPSVALVYADQLITEEANDTFATTKARKRWNWPAFSYAELEHRCIVGPQPMWRKGIHAKYGLFLPELRYVCDYEFWLRVAKTESFQRIPEILGLYYNNPGGAENTGGELAFQETVLVRHRYGLIARQVQPRATIPVPVTPEELESLPFRHAKAVPSNTNVAKEVSSSPLVSVIVPTHNRPERLAEALRSVLCQSLQAIEIIVVNDGGCDLDLRQLAPPTNHEIVYIKHVTNRGVAAARNTALRAASGRYIAYLDDDDRFYPDHLETLVAFLEKNPGCVAYTDACRVQQEKVGEQWNTVGKEVAYSQDWDNDSILVDNFVPTLCIMHERAMLKQCGFFDETLGSHEDWDLWIRLSRNYRWVHIPKVTCEFTRRTQASITAEGFGPFLLTMERIHARYASYVKGKPALVRAQRAKREELRRLSSPKATAASLKVAVLSLDERSTACAYLRWLAPLNYLHAQGALEHISVSDIIDGQLDLDQERLKRARVVVVQRGLAANLPYSTLRAALPDPATKIVFELDDALTMLPQSHQFFPYFQTVRPRMEEYLRQADLVTVSTPKLKELYSHLSDRIVVLPNAINTQLWLPTVPRHTHSDKVTILFSGTLTHQHDLGLIEKAIERIATEFPQKVEFLFWGNIPASLRHLPQIRTAANFTPDYVAYAQQLKRLPVDLALVPLEVIPFNRTKSPIKWLEYSACKIPAIFTNIEAYNQTVEHGKTGWLVPNQTDAWYEAMKSLILDPDLRRSIAENAHQTVLARHSLEQNAALWLQAYQQALAAPVQKHDARKERVSIVIPTFNNLALTRQCLDSILSHTPQGLYEVIVVDNASTDGTPAYLKALESTGRIRVAYNAQNRGFAEGCNQGALLAQTPHLVFLNNDTVVKPGWLQALLAAAEKPQVGIVGAKLLYPDGRIQHAGIEFINGLPDHPHRFAPADAPEVNQFREMDMVTGACLLIGRELFLQLAGFDETFRNGVEDIDLCLRARAAGWKVVYEPKAELFHHEGQSVGRFSHVQANLELFFSRWGKSFDSQKRFCVPKPPRIIPATQSLIQRQSKAQTRRKIQLAWEGTFLDYGSLSYVNREFTRHLEAHAEVTLTRVGSRSLAGGIPLDAAQQALAKQLATNVPSDAQVLVRHAWPPNWKAASRAALVVIQPWEFGSLPEEWVRQSAQVREFWVPSTYVREVYVDSGVPAEKVKVVPNGIDPKLFHQQVPATPLATKKSFKFLFVGGTIHRKGADALLEAYLRAFKSSDDVCLVIKDFGGKSFYAGQTLEKQIQSLQARPDAPEILYLNTELSPEALRGLYTACDCLVHPYRGEGFGLPVLEAMACGLPVIVTEGGAADDFALPEFVYAVPATRKIIGDSISGMKLVKPAWLLEPDLSALIAQMKHVLEHRDEARAKGAKASEYAHREWTWERSARIMAERLQVLAPQAKTESKAVSTRATAPILTKPLPACAQLGSLDKARSALAQKQRPEAWASTCAAIQLRPHHPEAYLLLAEIAQHAGDYAAARTCAEHARQLAPDWKPARKFLQRCPKGGKRPDWLKLPTALSPDQASRLTVCLIVKNEEKFLPRCLGSIKELAHQIVVVDTGSTDRTVEIAKEYGAEVHPFTWCDDFSAARNAALEHATGDWVLSLDADEELSAQGRDALRRHLADSAVMAWRLPLMDVGKEADGRSFVPRLFRNAPGFCFTGRVHEQIFTAVDRQRAQWGLDNRLGEALLLHHGYTDEAMRDRNKVERNLRLLEQAVTEQPGDPHLLMNLGLELSRSGREAEALERYREAFEILSALPKDQIPPELREAFLSQYCVRLKANRRFAEVVEVLSSPLAHAQNGLNASNHFNCGLAHLELGHFREAAEQMKHCLAKRKQPVITVVNKDIHTAGPFHILGMALAQIGDVAGAEKAYREGLNERGHADRLRFDFARFLFEQRRPVDALQMLNDALKEPTDLAPAMWRLGGTIALSQPQFLEFALEWTGEAVKNLPDSLEVAAQHGEALLLSQRPEAALPCWERVWQNQSQPQALAALVLCELAQGQPQHSPRNAAESAAASKAFIEWYRKCLQANAKDLIVRVNSRLAALRPVLPEAANLLEQALAESEIAEPAAARG